MIADLSEFADILLNLLERKDQLEVAQNDLDRATEEVLMIEEAIEELRNSMNDYQNNMNAKQQDYENIVNDMKNQYINMTEELR